MNTLTSVLGRALYAVALVALHVITALFILILVLGAAILGLIRTGAAVFHRPAV